MRNWCDLGMTRRSGLMVIGLAIILSQCVATRAATIRHSRAPESDDTVLKEWSRYVLAGPTVWADDPHPPVTAAVESEIWKSVRTDPGGTSPIVEFLLWKQSLDPTRFAHYHPKLAPVLHRIAHSRLSTTTTQQAITPTTNTGGSRSSTPSAPVTTEPQNLIPSASPEPSTLLLATGMAAWAVVRGRARRRDR
jgi:hypothetical protein